MKQFFDGRFLNTAQNLSDEDITPSELDSQLQEFINQAKALLGHLGPPAGQIPDPCTFHSAGYRHRLPESVSAGSVLHFGLGFGHFLYLKEVEESFQTYLLDAI